jgi:hypothetical protein
VKEKRISRANLSGVSRLLGEHLVRERERRDKMLDFPLLRIQHKIKMLHEFQWKDSANSTQFERGLLTFAPSIIPTAWIERR